MSAPVDLNADTFATEVLEQPGPVLVDFWSQSCPPCLQLNPQFAAAAQAHVGKVKFAKVAAQDAIQLFRDHRVMGTPTMVLFKDGAEAARKVGFATADEISAWLREQA